ncbi:MAG TPA: ABC transporter permease, partial [Rhodanobacter sp.]|nr:ABC transporter permease [Rhodanobacter sp.]
MLKHGSLVWELTKRDVIGRYRGSFLGLAWSFFNPLIMLVVYTFVFGFVFKSKWEGLPKGASYMLSFSLVLFLGLLIFQIAAEVINKAPTLITN